MILIDFNNILMTSLHASFPKKPKVDDFNPNKVRLLVINYIRMINVKFGSRYGRVIICADSPRTWRKDAFEYYKSHRKTDREKLTHIEWPKVYDLFDSIKKELVEYTHYPVLEIKGAEGDDIIATMVLNTEGPHAIVSRDRDFQQLQAYGDVVQYDHIEERMLTPSDPVAYLEEHIIRGDRNDGVPNILSDDDVLTVKEKRQSKMTEERLKAFLSTSVETWPNEIHRRNWFRNRTMIDLRSIPEEITTQILTQYEDQKGRKGHRLFDYFVKYRLSTLLDVVDQF